MGTQSNVHDSKWKGMSQVCQGYRKSTAIPLLLLCTFMTCYTVNSHKRCTKNSQDTHQSNLNKAADMQKHG